MRPFSLPANSLIVHLAWVDVIAWLDPRPAWITKDNRYVTSFHWSITQFTPASKPQVDPANMVPGTTRDLPGEYDFQYGNYANETTKV